MSDKIEVVGYQSAYSQMLTVSRLDDSDRPVVRAVDVAVRLREFASRLRTDFRSRYEYADEAESLARVFEEAQ